MFPPFSASLSLLWAHIQVDVHIHIPCHAATLPKHNSQARQVKLL
jgi:hypothetical protein